MSLVGFLYPLKNFLEKTFLIELIELWFALCFTPPCTEALVCNVTSLNAQEVFLSESSRELKVDISPEFFIESGAKRDELIVINITVPRRILF